jgi:uncharacterized protein YkwD
MAVACFATSFGCGDGVGHPIVERDPEAPEPPASGGGGGSWDGGSGSGSRGGFPVGGRGFVWGGSSGNDDVPPGEYCESVADSSDESRAGEQLFLELLNTAREYGFSCTTGAEGVPVPVPPVLMKPELRCAARLHSRDMAERGFFDHVNPNGVGPEDRIRSAGYENFRTAGESIIRGEAPAAGTVPFQALDALLSTGGSECQNLVDDRFDSVGIGNFGDFWTLDFAGP